MKKDSKNILSKMFSAVAAVRNTLCAIAREVCHRRKPSFIIKKFSEHASADQDLGVRASEMNSMAYFHYLRYAAENNVPFDPKSTDNWGNTEAMLIAKRIGSHGLVYYLHHGGTFDPDNLEEAKYFLKDNRDIDAEDTYREWLHENYFDLPDFTNG